MSTSFSVVIFIVLLLLTIVCTHATNVDNPIAAKIDAYLKQLNATKRIKEVDTPQKTNYSTDLLDGIQLQLAGQLFEEIDESISTLTTPTTATTSTSNSSQPRFGSSSTDGTIPDNLILEVDLQQDISQQLSGLYYPHQDQDGNAIIYTNNNTNNNNNQKDKSTITSPSSASNIKPTSDRFGVSSADKLVEDNQVELQTELFAQLFTTSLI